VAAVVSADFTLGYLYKILNDTLATCAQPARRCFLLEDRGNVVAHPGLNAALHQHRGGGGGGPLHLTHLEPFVATDLLAHHRIANGGLIRKRVCRASASGNLQRYMELDEGYSGVASNSAHLTGCSGPPLYYLTAVPGTNLFLGLVETACDGNSSGSSSNTAAFCWCSTLDRTCLDCQHWEQTECECPCECESKADSDDDKYCAAASAADSNDENSDNGDLPTILPCQDTEELFSGHLRARTTPRFLSAAHAPNLLPPCIHTDCAGRGDAEADCFGVLGCAWCTTEADGVTPLRQPFCAAQSECYSGVVGSASPYARVPRSGLAAGEQSSSSMLADTLDERAGFRSGFGFVFPLFFG
jgi:hypothetical protein